MSFKTYLETVSGHGLGEPTSALSHRPPVGNGKNILPQIFAHVYHIVENDQRKLSRKHAISDFRTCVANSDCWRMEGLHAAVITSSSPQTNVYDLPVVSPGVSSYTHNHVYELATQPLETRKPPTPVNTNFSRRRSQRDSMSPASHPHPLRSHSPWPGHLRTRTSRPRRRARLFLQAEKEALQKLFPAIEEGPEGDEDQKADEIHGLASASSISLVPSIVISDYDPVLAGLPGSGIFPVDLQNWRPEYEIEHHRSGEVAETSRPFSPRETQNAPRQQVKRERRS